MPPTSHEIPRDSHRHAQEHKRSHFALSLDASADTGVRQQSSGGPWMRRETLVLGGGGTGGSLSAGGGMSIHRRFYFLKFLKLAEPLTPRKYTVQLERKLLRLNLLLSRRLLLVYLRQLPTDVLLFPRGIERFQEGNQWAGKEDCRETAWPSLDRSRTRCV